MENYKSDMSPEINIEIRKALDRRDIYISLKQELEEEIQPFTSFYSSGSASHEDFIKQFLGFSNEYPFGFSNDYKLLKRLIQILEKKDILVFQTNKYGRKTIDVNKMRGFSIFFQEAPIIVINSGDTPSAKIFSLLHELCHLTLKENDISNSDLNQESYCNRITANLMMPKDIIKKYISSYSNLTLDEIKAIAKNQIVSQSALIWRIFNLNFISSEQKEDLYISLESSLKQLKPFGRQLSRSKRIVTDLGQLYVSTVFLAYYNDKIDSSDLINIFHVGWDNIRQIENQL
jgi:Zn-dependent peptidase ImmA (M78 family)